MPAASSSFPRTHRIDSLTPATRRYAKSISTPARDLLKRISFESFSIRSLHRSSGEHVMRFSAGGRDFICGRLQVAPSADSGGGGPDNSSLDQSVSNLYLSS